MIQNRQSTTPLNNIMTDKSTLLIQVARLPDNFDLTKLKVLIAGKFQGIAITATSRTTAKKNANLATISIITHLNRHQRNDVKQQIMNESKHFFGYDNISIATKNKRTNQLERTSAAGAKEKFEIGNLTEDPATNRAKTKKGKNSGLWTLSETLTNDFHLLVADHPELMERCADREEMGEIFQTFLASRDLKYGMKTKRERKLIESLVMAHLRRRKLLRSRRYNDSVIVVMAGKLGAGDFPTVEVRKTARERVMKKKEEDEKDKCGVQVSQPCTDDLLVKPNDTTELLFTIVSSNPMTKLTDIIIRGTAHRSYTVDTTDLLMRIPLPHQVLVSFHARGIGVYRATIKMIFANPNESFSVSKFLSIRSGDAVTERILQSTSPYERKKRKQYARPNEVILLPKHKDSGPNPFSKLPFHYIPREIRSLLINRELENILEKPDGSEGSYEFFWRNIIWANEFQADEDMKFYDMDEAILKQEGNLFVLEVPGLAEGRPSVLRGDIVKVSWQGKEYQGRVERIRLLDVMMELSGAFQHSFNPLLDRVFVRFTYSRKTLRTMHEGAKHADEEMGITMLAPTTKVVNAIQQSDVSRDTPEHFPWANRNLNEEQKLAVSNIVHGKCRPLPYIVFGPPGTGKTTVIVEAVYQLAKHKSCPKILIVAPSNDAVDILVEKLSAFFPPSEMRRILAYSRSLEQVSPSMRAYTKECLSDTEIFTEIQSSQLIVSTVNLAARFPFYGVPKGHFEVLIVDEAGHTTEPEIVSVATSVLDFTRRDKKVGQLILAGDPHQLGPVVTSSLCRSFGLGVSYMERLTNSEAYGRNNDNLFPAHLITKLVRNYRSHPDILKLPNEMFYEGDLVPCGEELTTHNMARWLHLPAQKFPLIFHAVHGENLREGDSPSWFNPQEAQEVVNYVDLLLNQSYPAVAQGDIGIITPYNRQAQKIRMLLEIRNIKNIKVGSVETFQGQERRCIIVSTVRAQSEYIASDLKYNLGFVANEKRFNVAITRAKSLVVVIGHPNILGLDTKNWLPFLQYCQANGGWRGEVWEEIDVAEPDDDFSLIDAGEGDMNDDWDVISIPDANVEQDGMPYVNHEV